MSEQSSHNGGAKRLVGNSLSCLVTRVLQLSLLVWVNQRLLKEIPTEEYSIFPLVMSLLVFTEIFTRATAGGVGRFMIVADAKNDKTEMSRIVSSILPLLFVVAFIFAVGGTVASFNIQSLIDIEPYYSKEAQIMLILLLIPVCLDIISTPFSCGPYVKNRFTLLNSIDLICEIVRVTIVLSLLLGVSTKVMWLVVASSSASLLNLSLRIWITRKIIPSARFNRSLVSFEKTKELTSFSSWSAVGSFMNLATSTFPLLLLGHFGTAVDVACFYLGRLPEINIRKISASIIRPLQPFLISIYATQGLSSMDKTYYRGGRYHLWITLVPIAPLIIFGPDLIELYAGEKYQSAAWVMMITLGVYPVIWASAMFYQISHASGKVGTYYRCEILSVVLMIVAAFITVKYFGTGAVGAAGAIALSTVVVHFARIYPLGLRQVGGDWNRFLRVTVIPGTAPLLSALITCFIFRSLWDLNSYLIMFLGGALATIVYVGVLLALCLDQQDKELLGKVLNKARSLLSSQKLKAT